jgi:DNA (cytosine-5)-methyltransferase 1
MDENKLTIIDLFSGTGAFTYVFENTNKFKCVFSNDFDKNSEIIYKLNFPLCNFNLIDLNLINVKNIPNHNILCGGFPCQPFSIAGDKKGFNDIRSNVFWKIIEILKEHQTEIVLLENVKNLITHDNGKTFNIIIEQLSNLNYFIKYKILDTSKITKIPQHRERIYIICFKDKNKYDNFDFNFNNIENNKIKDYLENNVDDKYYYTDRFKIYDNIKNEITKNINDNIVYQYRRFYVRENKNNCCPTLTANMGGGGHNVPLIKDDKGIRKLTPKECFNLQGFPIDYKVPDNLSDSSLYKLAGNAVSIPVIELIINNIIKIL